MSDAGDMAMTLACAKQWAVTVEISGPEGLMAQRFARALVVLSETAARHKTTSPGCAIDGYAAAPGLEDIPPVYNDKKDDVTPRTDAAIGRGGGSSFNAIVMRCERVIACSRQLERELETCRDAHIANCLAADTLRTEVRERRALQSAVARSEPDSALADRIERELKELQALKEDRGDPEYWVLQTFIANADRICAALRAPRSASVASFMPTRERLREQIAADPDSEASTCSVVDTDARDAARYRFRHSNYVDKDGYEYGYCKVRWKNGVVESMLWADDAEIDAAMNATDSGMTNTPKDPKRE